MMSRLAYCLGRLPVTRYPVQSSRFLSCSTVHWDNAKPAAQAPTVAPVTSTRGRGGLTGFLYEKTGVTGPWMLGVGVSAYLISKEFYVINSETLLAFIIGGMVIFLMKNVGKPIAQFLDGKSQDILELLSGEKNARIAAIKDAMEHESKGEGQLSMRHDIFEILKENNGMRMEEEYRRRLHQVSNKVRRRLDYQVDVETTQRKFEQRHMIQWLEQTVTESVSGKQDESFDQCLSVLKKMSVA